MQCKECGGADLRSLGILYSVELYVCFSCGAIHQRVGYRWHDGETEEDTGIEPVLSLVGRAKLTETAYRIVS